MIVLANNYCFDNELLADAIALPSGAFIEVDDLTFQLNGMGRKVAQTMRVTIEGPRPVHGVHRWRGLRPRPCS